MHRILWSALALLCLVSLPCGVTAEPDVNEVQLRDELIQHFARDNLLPVFLPRDQAVGDVLDARGAFFARQKNCFPTLQIPTSKNSDHLTKIVVGSKVEGNFGIGLKRIADFLFKAGASSSARVTITFSDITYSETTTTDLRKAFSKKNCPDLETLVMGSAMEPPTPLKTPMLVLQEVYYARKEATIELDRGANVGVTVDAVRNVVGSLDLQTSASQNDQILISSKDRVPVAVRLAFVPQPITNVTLGGEGSAKLQGYLWQPVFKVKTHAEREGLDVITQAILAATAGNQNPLIE